MITVVTTTRTSSEPGKYIQEWTMLKGLKEASTIEVEFDMVSDSFTGVSAT